MILTCLIAQSEEEDGCFRENAAYLGLMQVILQKKQSYVWVLKNLHF